MSETYLEAPWIQYEIDDTPPDGYGFIYEIVSPVGKSYIGQTTRTVEERINEHCKPSCRCWKISRAIKSYGKDHMDTFVIGAYPKDILNSKEEEIISKRNSIAEGYNIANGGGVISMTDDIREKISKTLKGRKFSNEHRNKISKAKKGKKQSPEHIRKNSEGHKGIIKSSETRIKLSLSHKGENHYGYGKHLSRKHRDKISESVKRIHLKQGCK